MGSAVIAVGSLSARQVGEVLTTAALAPSLHNSQPWRFRCTASAIEVHADLDRALPGADGDHRELVLACGAALFNLRLAIRALGRYTDVRLYPSRTEPYLLAAVRPQGRRNATPEELGLAAAIRHRHTNRKPFTDEPVPSPVRAELRRAAEQERAWLALMAPAQLPRLRHLVHQAFFRQQDDPAFRTEWRAWTGRTRDSLDGVPSDTAGPLPEAHDQWVMRDYSAGTARPRLPGKDFETEPLIAVLGSFHDLPLARLQAGQALQRILLTATCHGLSASFLSQVVEVPHTRRQLRELIGGGLWPQTVLRLGRGTPVPHTPRRGLDDIVAPSLSVQ